jgi:hypothetical protein
LGSLCLKYNIDPRSLTPFDVPSRDAPAAAARNTRSAAAGSQTKSERIKKNLGFAEIFSSFFQSA